MGPVTRTVAVLSDQFSASTKVCQVLVLPLYTAHQQKWQDLLWMKSTLYLYHIKILFTTFLKPDLKLRIGCLTDISMALHQT